MNNYHQEGFIPMEQYMAQFTGEEPAQVREHSRVVELEREVERLRAALKWYATPMVYSEFQDGDTLYFAPIFADKGQRARKALNSE